MVGNIDYYMIEIDSEPPLQVRNNTITVLLPQTGNHTVRIRAVDKCGQKGDWQVQTFADAEETTTTAPKVELSLEYYTDSADQGKIDSLLHICVYTTPCRLV